MNRRNRLLHYIVACLPAIVLATAHAMETPLASYEPSETDLTISVNNGADAGLTATRVQGGVNGAPVATDGDYVLKLDFAGEDGKIEFTHEWASTTYDLDGNDELLADVYVATASALPGVVGIWTPEWSPPDAWQSASGIPVSVGEWTTVSFNVASRDQIDLDRIWAFVFENLPGATGTIYIDNLRFYGVSHAVDPDQPAAIGFEDRIELAWPAIDGVDGYNIYRSSQSSGPFTKINTALFADIHYVDPTGVGYPRYYYQVTSVDGVDESAPSPTVSALYDGYTDDQLMDLVQQRTFQYFWNFAHPTSGLIRESYTIGDHIIAIGGSGMGLMAICVGTERGFVSREDAADRVLQMLTFLNEHTTRYKGAWSHWINGQTGATIPFTTKDNGGDLVETSYLAQGFLTVRQYFDGPGAVETQIRDLATELWEGIEWDEYERYPGSEILYWHWSPDYGWDMNMSVSGYNEAMITYLMAIASPTHPMPGSSYYNGWARFGGYANGNSYYGIPLAVGPAYGGPLFWCHYTFLGFDPRYKRDAYCNYLENSRHIALIHQAHSIINPLDYAGYGRWVWGLTASVNPWGYAAHEPTADNGTISPTAALSSMPFTPEESLATMRHWLDTYGGQLFNGPYGFWDAFNFQENWVGNTYIAIDQGPIIVMIENYRTGLCWRLFMSDPDVRDMLANLNWELDGDLDNDGYINESDHAVLVDCLSGPGMGVPPANCTAVEFADADVDNDGDVDLADFAIFGRAYQGP